MEGAIWHRKKTDHEEYKKSLIEKHYRFIEKEIARYSAQRNSPEKEYLSNKWAIKKGVTLSKAPSNCNARAKRQPCYKETSISDCQKKRISSRAYETFATELYKRKQRTSPRNPLERVKKIQELRNIIINKDEKSRKNAEMIFRNYANPPIKQKVLSRRTTEDTNEDRLYNPTYSYDYNQHSRKVNNNVYKKNQENINLLKRQKKKKRKGSPSSNVVEGISDDTVEIKVDNYFPSVESAKSVTPDSGLGMESTSVSVTPNAKIDNSMEAMSLTSDIKSPRSDLDETPTFENNEQSTTTCLEAGLSTRFNKSVRFNNNVCYEDSPQIERSLSNVSNGELRSCLKSPISKSLLNF